MNIKTLSISSLVLVASFIQCNDVQKVETSPQEDAFAAYLEMTELQKQFINSTALNTEQLAKGIYIYEIRNKKKDTRFVLLLEKNESLWLLQSKPILCLISPKYEKLM